MFLVDNNPDPATRFYQSVDAEHFFGDSDQGGKIKSLFFKKFDGIAVISILRVFRAFFVSLINSKQPWFLFSLENVEIGKSINATLLREVRKAHLSRLTYMLMYFRFLFISCFVFAYAERHREDVAGLSLDNVFYWNGILVDYFLAKNGVWVYLHLPHFGKMCVKQNFENLSALMKYLEDDAASRESELPERSVHEYMDKRLSNPRDFGLVLEPTEAPLNISTRSDETNVVVYVHSFADAQMERGWDGFRCASDWLLFTVEELQKRNSKTRIFVKAHPNFFIGQSGWTAPEFDRQIWRVLEKEIQSRCVVISGATPNKLFLNAFEPTNTVLISHHGNAIVEGAYMGFRTISSGMAIWGRNYSFSTNWLSKDDYLARIDAIERMPQLSEDDLASLTQFISDFYIRSSSDDAQKRALQKIITEELQHQGLDYPPPTDHLPYPLDRIKLLLSHLDKEHLEHATIRFSDVIRVIDRMPV